MLDFEVILIDDGSTDQSPVLCDRYARDDARFRVVHQKNTGVSAARNRGIKLAQGKYITFIDSDDSIGRHYLANLHQLAAKYDADIVTSPILKFVKKMPAELFINNYNHDTVSPETATLNLLYGKNKSYAGIPGGKLYQTNLIRKRGFREDLKYSEDVAFFYSALQAATTIVATNYSGYMYRVRPGSATQSGFRPAFMDYRLERAKLIDRESNRKIKRAWQSNLTFNMIYYLSLMDRTQDQKYWEVASRILRRYRISTIFDIRQRLDQKLLVISSLLGSNFAIRIFQKAKNRNVK